MPANQSNGFEGSYSNLQSKLPLLNHSQIEVDILPRSNVEQNLLTNSGVTVNRPLSACRRLSVNLDAPVPNCQKFCYGVGGIPMQMTSNVLSFYLNPFLVGVAAISPNYIAIIQLCCRVWDAVTDPITGYLVNKTETRLGKFRPWLLASCPFVILSFFFLFFVPNTSEGWKFFFYLFMSLMLMTSLTAFHVPYSSMTMVLTTEVKDRDKCSAIRMGFELSGVLLGIGIFGTIVQQYETKGTGSCDANATTTNNVETLKETDKLGYMFGALATCSVVLLCGLTAFFGVRERPIPIEAKENYLRSLKHILKFQPYVRLMFAFLFISLGIQLIQGNLVFLMKYSLNLNNHIVYGLLTILVSAIANIPLIQFVMSKLGKKVAFLSGLIVMMPIQIMLVFLPSSPPLYVFYGIMIVGGYTVGVAFLLPWSMLPDVIDDFTLKYKVRKESAFYSFYVFFNKCAVGISLALSMKILKAVGFQTGACTQPMLVGNAIRYLTGPGSMACFFVSGFFLYLYPIDESYRIEVKEKLKQRRLERDAMERSSATIMSQLTIVGAPVASSISSDGGDDNNSPQLTFNMANKNNSSEKDEEETSLELPSNIFISRNDQYPEVIRANGTSQLIV